MRGWTRGRLRVYLFGQSFWASRFNSHPERGYCIEAWDPA